MSKEHLLQKDVARMEQAEAALEEIWLKFWRIPAPTAEDSNTRISELDICVNSLPKSIVQALTSSNEVGVSRLAEIRSRTEKIVQNEKSEVVYPKESASKGERRHTRRLKAQQHGTKPGDIH